MNIHEYQAKELLSKYGVAVPKGRVAFTPDEAEEIAKGLLGSNSVCVVKAQIHAGGRGKAGGVKSAKSHQEARQYAEGMLGKKLITHQTGPEGKEVKKVLIEEGCQIARELYLGIVVDRAAQRVVVMASSEGGIEIEEVAAKSPEKILKEYVDPAVGLIPFQARKLAFGLGIDKALVNKTVKFMNGLYKAFVDSDASMTEINPLVITKGGDILALDAKMGFDDNGLFRHKEVHDMRDLDEEDLKEIEASRHSLNYVALNGNIGCMVNGAGLAMATMDIIKLYGGMPANFLDVGGGANKEQVTAAFKILMSDEKVKAVLINIFGGIMRCDIIAEGVIAAVKEVGIKVPLVVRLQGTNVELGRKILSESGLNIITAEKMDEAGEKVVKAAN
ncbi:MAG: succinate--CoA ligase subunit beta [Nitrospinae bacterium RIFCSPLOWO2_02_FULL_39_110]|nr:MAG: succinate--CoA ligase subunit beta [Nitrospinae bacterium RIFCSPHIGHO2_02_39_11]OGV98576.1 MAG: succinate--CoA ligase subunit beta [Nitrospinae bacterium RIFCSPHIGHO2_12_FULL_39_42]OGW00554.1 MAG: succinate--CoA ligase subunit beta [Nitrospinae bacterium RIFCSPHIGHO2_02_FULL_39_82]OGW01308.1 MAG: succinate--CoA ligase subunit beta [Nitrospinae bacterium RIFCSPLOWO2_02_39_17]OGW04488.1 MAG: succinate--CoA ligase subunit beta [Nitrospinae bacterium RIFCSPLOWO2_02_FULL_39_110]OGW09835.1 M